MIIVKHPLPIDILSYSVAPHVHAGAYKGTHIRTGSTSADADGGRSRPLFDGVALYSGAL